MYYSKRLWRKARQGDIVFGKSGIHKDKVCIVVRTLSKEEHSYGSTYGNGEVAKLAPCSDPANTKDWWNVPEAFDILTLDPEGHIWEENVVSAQSYYTVKEEEEETMDTVSYGMEKAWHSVVPGDVVVGNHATGELFNKQVMVVVAVEDDMATLVSYMDPRLRVRIKNNFNSFCTLERNGSGSYYGPSTDTIARMLAGQHPNYNATGGNDMETPLVIKTAKIVKVLKAKLAEKVAAWDEKQAVLAAQNAQTQANFDAVIAKYPGFVRTKFSYHVCDLSNFGSTDEALAYIEKSYNESDLTPAGTVAIPFGGDESLERMIRTLELADNDTVEIKPTDPVYNLL